MFHIQVRSELYIIFQYFCSVNIFFFKKNRVQFGNQAKQGLTRYTQTYEGQSIIIRTVCFIFRKTTAEILQLHNFFNMVPLLYNALSPSPHNLLYDLRIKRFGLRDKPRMYRYIQLLVRGKPTTS